MSAVAWLKETLDGANAHYQVTHHKESFTSQEMAHQEHVSGHKVAKTVAVDADGKNILLALPATRKVSLQRIKEILGAQAVRLMSEGEMTFHFRDCEVGAAPPFRHWEKVDLWMDSSLDSTDEILFHAGNHIDAVRMPLSEWKKIAHPRVESFTIESTHAGHRVGEEYWT